MGWYLVQFYIKKNAGVAVKCKVHILVFFEALFWKQIIDCIAQLIIFFNLIWVAE